MLKGFRTIWFLGLGFAAVVFGLWRHVIADAFGIPRPPGQYLMAAVAVVLGALAVAPMFMFRNR
jgi:hypothetical protein